jgi:hypothetical protein
VNCPICGSRQPWLAPGKALRAEEVRCGNCHGLLNLASDTKSVRKKIVVALEIAVTLSIAVAFVLTSVLLAVGVFLVIQVALVSYLYGSLFKWAPTSESRN